MQVQMRVQLQTQPRPHPHLHLQRALRVGTSGLLTGEKWRGVQAHVCAAGRLTWKARSS